MLTLNRGKSKAVFACTLRNAETLNSFLQLLTSNNLNITKEEDEPAKVFCYDRSFPVHIYTVELEDSS
ncbi:hypothetical protein B566_EDAN001381 [Ephemera danica]|nr:hypothetical protein B566_EDAN001381 [Ephemera danica]